MQKATGGLDHGVELDLTFREAMGQFNFQNRRVGSADFPGRFHLGQANPIGPPGNNGGQVSLSNLGSHAVHPHHDLPCAKVQISQRPGHVLARFILTGKGHPVLEVE